MKTKRQHEILKLLMLKRSLRTDQLVEQFGVSIETIRRDISELERGGLVKKVYGGIKLVTGDTRITVWGSWNQRLAACHAEKMAIAGRTLDMIPDGSTIALDTGTTVYEFSRLLVAKQNLTIITNSLKIASELSQNTQHTIYTVGGAMQRGEIVTVGTFACGFLDNFAAIDYFICSADGITSESGITEFNESMVDVKRRMVAIADKTIAMVDSSKFGKKALFKSCATQDIDILVTDPGAPEMYLEAIRNYDVEIVIADLQTDEGRLHVRAVPGFD